MLVMLLAMAILVGLLWTTFGRRIRTRRVWGEVAATYGLSLATDETGNVSMHGRLRGVPIDVYLTVDDSLEGGGRYTTNVTSRRGLLRMRERGVVHCRYRLTAMIHRVAQVASTWR